MTDETTEVTTDGNSAPAPQPSNLEVRTEQYIKLRDLIKEKDEAHKVAMAPYRETLEKLNNFLLDELNKLGVDSVKSTAGSVYRTHKRSASLEDSEQFLQFVINTEQFDLLDRKANLKAVDDYMATNGVLPPGVKLSSHSVVGVRRS